MTNEKAINELHKFERCHYEKPNGDADLDVYDALSIAINAIKKQIPAIPDEFKSGMTVDFNGNVRKRMSFRCPNGHNQPTQRYKFCPFCGQLLNWKGVEDKERDWRPR